MPPGRAHYRLTFAVLSSGAFGFSLLQSLVIPAIPTIQHELRTSASAASWLLTSYLLSAAVATPIAGRLGDMLGKARVLVVTLVLLALGTLVCALSSSISLMIFGRAVQGLAGGVFPLAYGIIRDEFPHERVAGAIGLVSAILGIGTGVGVVVAGPVIDHLSYHWLYWAPLVLVVAACALTAAFVPESPVRSPGAVNWTGAALMSAWLVALLLGMSEAPEWGWTNPTVLGLFAASAVVALAWARSERRSTHPLVDIAMLRIPAVWRTNLSGLLLGAGMYTFFIIVPNFVQTPRSSGYGFSASVTGAGLFLLPLAVTMLASALLAGRLTARFGSKALLVAGCTLSAAAFVLLVGASGAPLDFYLSSALAGVGIGLGFASMTNLVVAAVPHRQTGVATAMNSNLRSIGGALGTGISTSIIVSSLLASGLPSEHGYALAFLLCAVLLVAAALASLSLASDRRERVETVGAPPRVVSPDKAGPIEVETAPATASWPPR